MEAINDASKYVAQSHKLLEDYLALGSIDNEALLLAARDLLFAALEVLAKAM